MACQILTRLVTAMYGVAIGRRLFLIERIVYADAQGVQFVFDDQGHKIVGVWLYRDESDADNPDAISTDHDIDSYLIGAPAKPLRVSAFGLIVARRSLSESAIGGIDDTQEIIVFRRTQHHLRRRSHTDSEVNETYERLLKSDVKDRFSIEKASLKSE